ncbi:MAG: preprotein translocase subunit SecG [Mycoplasmataceae bacterium]|jgi:preprotein translocase subunit SecG|nr:preprotein translocase subunit SecG [Mycoplasmataceae bacterium]
MYTAITVLSVFVILIGLLLSSSGSSSGLVATSGQDLELFRKTKDRGLIKWLQIILFLIVIIILTIIVANGLLGIQVA